MSAVSPTLAAARFEATQVISISVLDDMRLFIEPVEIARDAEHNAATFRIVRQPASLDGYACRAEVKNAQGSTYRLVVDGEFALTSEIAVLGVGQLQLVYSDGGDIIRKTYAANFHVSASINAIDPGAPEYENGLAQLTTRAFANAVGNETGITFYNIPGQPVGAVVYPPGSGGGLDEATADLLYLRLNGTNPMQGSVAISGPNRGIVWGDSGIQGALYSDGTQLIFRRAINDTDVVIENNSGASATRSPIVTQAGGDLRYVRPFQLEEYLLKTGGQMTGPFVSQTGSSNTNLGVSVGDNATGFWRSGLYLIVVAGGQTIWQSSTTEMIFGVRLNAATQQITNVGDPTSAQDAVNRRTMDAAIAAIPRPIVPASRTFIANEVTIGTAATEFFNQPFFTADNATRTILVTVYPQFSGGQPSSFYDLEYSTGLSVGLIERSTVYPTAQGYMGGGQAVCFAATVTPVSSQIQVSLSVRMMAANPGPDLIQIGSRTTQRSYVVIQEMTQ